MKIRFLKYVLTLVSLGLALSLNAQSIRLLQQGNPTSIRGLSVVDDSVAWISGSKGTIALSHNGGKTWDWQKVKGFETTDFRDIEAFSDKEAVIMSSGTPALILKTIDGGANWQVKYRNADTVYFFDAMDFANPKHGYVLGDPIKNKFVLMETKDGGETWNPFKYPPDALADEAAFAASGTCLRVTKNNLTIVTGGAHSRELIFISDDKTPNAWLQNALIFQHKKPSQGAFSFATNGKTNIFVGGDYANDEKTDSVASYLLFDGTYSGGSMLVAKTPPSGFQSCVEFISSDTFLSTGTPGSNITTDGGKTWAKIDNDSFNVCRKAKHGKLVLLAGNGGKIGLLQM